MAINDAPLRSLTARDLIAGLAGDGFVLAGGSTPAYFRPEGRRVTVSFHGPAETFETETLRTMIEVQARRSDEDLRRLKLF